MEPGPQAGPAIPAAAEGADIPVLFRLPQVGARPAANAGRSRESSSFPAAPPPHPSTHVASLAPSSAPVSQASVAQASVAQSPAEPAVNGAAVNGAAVAQQEKPSVRRSSEHWFDRVSAMRGVTTQWFIVGVVAVIVVGGVAWWRNQDATSRGPKTRDRAPLVLNIDEGTEAEELHEPNGLNAESDGPVARMASRIDESAKPTARPDAVNDGHDHKTRNAGTSDGDSGPQLDLQPPLMSPGSGTEPADRSSSGASSLAPPLPATPIGAGDSGRGDMTSQMDEPVPPRPTGPDGAATPDLSSGADAATAPYPRTNPATYLYRDDSQTTVARRNDDPSTDSRGPR